MELGEHAGESAAGITERAKGENERERTSAGRQNGRAAKGTTNTGNPIKESELSAQ